MAFLCTCFRPSPRDDDAQRKPAAQPSPTPADAPLRCQPPPDADDDPHGASPTTAQDRSSAVVLQPGSGAAHPFAAAVSKLHAGDDPHRPPGAQPPWPGVAPPHPPAPGRIQHLPAAGLPRVTDTRPSTELLPVAMAAPSHGSGGESITLGHDVLQAGDAGLGPTSTLGPLPPPRYNARISMWPYDPGTGYAAAMAGPPSSNASSGRLVGTSGPLPQGIGLSSAPPSISSPSRPSMQHLSLADAAAAAVATLAGVGPLGLSSRHNSRPPSSSTGVLQGGAGVGIYIGSSIASLPGIGPPAQQQPAPLGGSLGTVFGAGGQSLQSAYAIANLNRPIHEISLNGDTSSTVTITHSLGDEDDLPSPGEQLSPTHPSSVLHNRHHHRGHHHHHDEHQTDDGDRSEAGALQSGALSVVPGSTSHSAPLRRVMPTSAPGGPWPAAGPGSGPVAAALQVGGRGGGEGFVRSASGRAGEGGFVRTNAEEVAYIRESLAALKQATLAGLDPDGADDEHMTLPGLPRPNKSGGNSGFGGLSSAPSFGHSGGGNAIGGGAPSTAPESQGSVTGGRAGALATGAVLLHESNLAALLGPAGSSSLNTSRVSNMTEPERASSALFALADAPGAFTVSVDRAAEILMEIFQSGAAAGAAGAGAAAGGGVAGSGPRAAAAAAAAVAPWHMPQNQAQHQHEWRQDGSLSLSLSLALPQQVLAATAAAAAVSEAGDIASTSAGLTSAAAGEAAAAFAAPAGLIGGYGAGGPSAATAAMPPLDPEQQHFIERLVQQRWSPFGGGALILSPLPAIGSSAGSVFAAQREMSSYGVAPSMMSSLPRSSNTSNSTPNALLATGHGAALAGPLRAEGSSGVVSAVAARPTGGAAQLQDAYKAGSLLAYGSGDAGGVGRTIDSANRSGPSSASQTAMYLGQLRTYLAPNGGAPAASSSPPVEITQRTSLEGPAPQRVPPSAPGGGTAPLTAAAAAAGPPMSPFAGILISPPSPPLMSTASLPALHSTVPALGPVTLSTPASGAASAWAAASAAAVAVAAEYGAASSLGLAMGSSTAPAAAGVAAAAVTLSPWPASMPVTSLFATATNPGGGGVGGAAQLDAAVLQRLVRNKWSPFSDLLLALPAGGAGAAGAPAVAAESGFVFGGREPALLPYAARAAPPAPPADLPPRADTVPMASGATELLAPPAPGVGMAEGSPVAAAAALAAAGGAPSTGSAPAVAAPSAAGTVTGGGAPAPAEQ